MVRAAKTADLTLELSFFCVISGLFKKKKKTVHFYQYADIFLKEKIFFQRYKAIS